MGTPDAAAVRRLVVALGNNKKVKKVQLETTSGQTLRGRIQEVGADALTLDAGRQTPVQIAYRDISQLEPRGMAGWKKALMISGVTYGAVLGGVLIALIIVTSGSS